MPKNRVFDPPEMSLEDLHPLKNKKSRVFSDFLTKNFLANFAKIFFNMFLAVQLSTFLGTCQILVPKPDQKSEKTEKPENRKSPLFPRQIEHFAKNPLPPFLGPQNKKTSKFPRENGLLVFEKSLSNVSGGRNRSHPGENDFGSAQKRDFRG